MSNPTIPNYFGASAQVLTADTPIVASAANPAIVIRVNDFAGQGLTNVESASDPDKVLVAIIKTAHAWQVADNTEDPGTEIATPTKSFTTRNTQSVIAWLYYVSFFTPDNTSAQPDPDEVV